MSEGTRLYHEYYIAEADRCIGLVPVLEQHLAAKDAELTLARQRIAFLERHLIAQSLDHPTREYHASRDQLPFASPESPFPPDTSETPDAQDEEGEE